MSGKSNAPVMTWAGNGVLATATGEGIVRSVRGGEGQGGRARVCWRRRRARASSGRSGAGWGRVGKGVLATATGEGIVRSVWGAGGGVGW